MSRMSTQQQSDFEAWLDNLDPSTIEWKDAAPMRRIAAAREAVDLAEQELRDAVQDASRLGHSWSAISLWLGTSEQAAHRKYAIRD